MSMKENTKNISRFKNCFLLWNLSKFDYKSFANSFICFSLVFSLVLTSFSALAATESDVETDYYDISVADLVSDNDVSDNNDYNINCENTTNPLQPYVLNKNTGLMEPVSIVSQSLFKVSNSLMASSNSTVPDVPDYFYEYPAIGVRVRMVDKTQTGTSISYPYIYKSFNGNSVSVNLPILGAYYYPYCNFLGDLSQGDYIQNYSVIITTDGDFITNRPNNVSFGTVFQTGSSYTIASNFGNYITGNYTFQFDSSKFDQSPGSYGCFIFTDSNQENAYNNNLKNLEFHTYYKISHADGVSGGNTDGDFR